MKCQCEDISHFNGIKHKHMTIDAVTTIKTDYGIFYVCQECFIEKHMREKEEK